MTPSGIEPATFRFVVQYLNHCDTAVPNTHVLNTNQEMYCLPCCPTFRYGDTNDSDGNDDGYATPPICVCVCVHARALILETRVHKTKHCCSRWKSPIVCRHRESFRLFPLVQNGYNSNNNFCLHGSTDPVGQGLLIIEDSRSHTDILQSALLL